MLDTLDDPDVHHYVVEYDGDRVAQCITFPLDPRRGSFDDTLHVSALAVRPEHEHRGIAQALVVAPSTTRVPQDFATPRRTGA